MFDDKKLLSRIAAAAVAGYFLYFAIPALRAGFAPDDPMNAGEYWLRGLWRSAGDVALFWSTAYRPLGAFFYLPIYHLFGFSPVPFRIAALALVAANVFLTWRVAVLLTESQAAGALAAMLASAHASMVAIFFNTSMIYDILAYFFVALTLFFYLTFRRGGRELSAGQFALVIAAFVAALDSKELAVVGAGWVLAYELLFERPWRLRAPVVLCLLSIVYTLGKFLGPNPLAKQEGYLLDLSLHRYLLNNRLYLNDLFYSQFFTTSRRLVFAWLALTAICWIARRRELWWCWFLVSTATLGISFTIQPRGGSGLYIPLFAWALLASALVAVLLRRPMLQWGAALAIALIAAWYTIPYWRPQPEQYFAMHRLTMTTLAQIQALPQPAPHSRVIFLKDPFPNGYDVLFMAILRWNDPSLQVDLGNKFTTPPDLNGYQWILSFDGPSMRVVKRPQR
ncbi:MAG TPA: glycosyltransferase family 39 protein [Bryobacteraceae bacterium]|nr:glycosyltransferase family 39 protein [Bryobacteraceae bacterium]